MSGPLPYTEETDAAELRKEIAMLREMNSILMEQAAAVRTRNMQLQATIEGLERTLEDLRKDGLAF